MDRRRPTVEVGWLGKRGKPIREAGVPKNMEACLLYKLLRLVLFKNNHDEVGKFGEETKRPFFLPLLISKT